MQQAGERTIEGVRSVAAAAQQATDEAYSQVGNASLKVEGQRGLFTRLKRVAKTSQFETHPDLAPATNKALSEIEDYSLWLDEGKGRPLAMRRLETFRKRINNWIGSAKNPTDKAQVVMLKREFDSYLDKAIDKALFTGDQEALTQLKKARGLHSDYMKTFTQQKVKGRNGIIVNQDEGGAIVQRMIEGDPNPTETVNYLFGISTLGAKRGPAARAAQRLKDVLPSEDWNSLRQAGFLRMTDPGKYDVISSQKFLTNLTKSLNENPELMNTLYSKDELATMNRFALAIQRAQPDKAKYGNVSRSAYKGAEIIGNLWEKMMVGFGFSHGGVVGAAVTKGGVEGMKQFGRWRRSAEASFATRQKPLTRLNAGGYGAAGALYELNAE